jgi:hypothetical protein
MDISVHPKVKGSIAFKELDLLIIARSGPAKKIDE